MTQLNAYVIDDHRARRRKGKQTLATDFHGWTPMRMKDFLLVLRIAKQQTLYWSATFVVFVRVGFAGDLVAGFAESISKTAFTGEQVSVRVQTAVFSCGESCGRAGCY